MTWQPISWSQLQELVVKDLVRCAPRWQAFYERTRIPPAKWELPRWGDEGGGLWAVAVHEDRVLWYNDIEEGFNVSAFTRWGTIDEYRCNQDPLAYAMPCLGALSK